uniref:Uncharacterized protein n=1 Tax=Oryza rufipogon TaxID=4529 RepID=A0A0E0RBN7_ORYRU
MSEPPSKTLHQRVGVIRLETNYLRFSPLIQQEKVTAHQLDHTLLVPTWKTTPRFSPSPAATNRRIPPLAAAAEGLAMTTAPHELIGSRRAVGEEASTAVEETPAAGFCRRKFDEREDACAAFEIEHLEQLPLIRSRQGI